MPNRIAIAALAIVASVMTAADVAAADAQYPNLKGQWNRIGSPRWDQNDRWGERAPLTPEYKAIHAANLADQRSGGQGTDPTYLCIAPGMPRAMVAYEAMEVVVTPDTTYILIDHIHDSRRIFTDGRGFGNAGDPTFAGFSIGKWIDQDGDGTFDVLEVETRNLKGPRAFDESGLPLHADNKTTVKERIWLDKADPDLLHDEITTIDNALVAPWTVTRHYRREAAKYPVWREVVCAENNLHLRIGKDDFFLSADGFLMPTRKDQAPPDLRYFKQTRDQK